MILFYTKAECTIKIDISMILYCTQAECMIDIVYTCEINSSIRKINKTGSLDYSSVKIRIMDD